MAYQARGRDPLLDSNMAAAIERRGKELLGLVLLVLAAMAAAMIVSYSPDDPSWISATDAPVENWLGAIGATIAAPLFMIVGWGAWGLGIVLGAWGVRFALHWGQDRAIGRLIFAPIWVAVLALYASSLTPGAEWNATHNFGLGGLFGDTILGAALGILPFGASVSLKLLSVLLGVGMLVLGAFVLGFTRLEVMRIAKFLLVGIIMTYASLMTLLGKGAAGAGHTARAMQERLADRRERRLQAAEDEFSDDGRRREPRLAHPRIRHVLAGR